MITKDQFSRYLSYGTSKPLPCARFFKESDISFNKAKAKLQKLAKTVILDSIKKPEDVIFQCSGGFDSSLVISFFENVSTFCTCRSEMSDFKYSKMVSNHFKTKHKFISEEDLTKGMNLEKTLLKMNSIHSLPRSYTNDPGLYLFVKRIKEETDIIAGGEGIEFMYLGYSNMFLPIIYSAISKGQYSIDKAKKYRDYAKVLKGFKIDFDFNHLIKLIGGNTLYYEVPFWWATGFTFNDVKDLNIKVDPLREMNLFNFVNFMFDWIGNEFYFDRRLEYANHFKLKWISPFLDERFINFSLSLPIEMRNCLGQIKYVMYESLGELLPEFVVNRPKEGLVLSQKFYEERYPTINKLLDKYLDDRKAKIYDFIDYKHVLSLRERFKNKYDFDTLKKVWSLLNFELWLELNK